MIRVREQHIFEDGNLIDKAQILKRPRDAETRNLVRCKPGQFPFAQQKPAQHEQVAAIEIGLGVGEGALDKSGHPLGQMLTHEARLLLKRLTDIVVAALALIILSPLLALIALLTKMSSPGPILFRQQRCGLNGRHFTLLKFRTMVVDAEQRQAELAHLNVKQVNFKIPNDPRQTGVGRWLRKFSLDELPQLWNVLRGQMSLVGPRPAIPSEVEQYKRWQRRRLRMRPGLTSLWAVEGRDALGFEETMRLDLAYIDSWSLPLDWFILLRTIPRVVTGKGAH